MKPQTMKLFFYKDLNLSCISYDDKCQTILNQFYEIYMLSLFN